MKCRFCGTTLPDSAKYCPGCGREIDRKIERQEEREASNIPEDAYYRTISDEKAKELDEKLYEGYGVYSNETEKSGKEEEKVHKKKNHKNRDSRFLKGKSQGNNKVNRKEPESRRTNDTIIYSKEVNNKNNVDNRRAIWNNTDIANISGAGINNTNNVEDDSNNINVTGNSENNLKSGRISPNNTETVRANTRISPENVRANTRISPNNTEAIRVNTNKKKSAGKRKYKRISVKFIVAYLAIVLTGGFALYKMGFPEKIVEMISKQPSMTDSQKDTSQKDAGKNSKKNSQKNEKEEQKAGKGTSEEKKNKDSKTEESVLAYTDNSSMNVGECLSPQDYNTVTAKDDSFQFAYPKYLFNHSEVDESGTSYKLSYKGESDSSEAELVVYTQEDEGDPLQNVRALYQDFSSEVYKKYFKMYPSRVDSSGMARTLIGASTDSSEKTGVYIIAANDGKKDYILKFTYPDPDMTDDYNEIDYVVDCVYRFCSFSGGTYQPRSYQQFLNDNMGSKK